MLYATVRQRKVFVKKPTTIVRNGVNVDTLILEMDDEWAEMTSIKCIFSLKYSGGETKKELLHTFGKEILVPWECLTKTGKMSVSCVGYVGAKQIMRTMAADSFWDVIPEGADTGDEPLEPTPTLYNQVIEAAGAANAAAAQATEIRANLIEMRDNGEFNGRDGVPPKVEIGAVQTGAEGSEAQVTNTGTAPNVVLNFVIPRGSRGLTGGVGPAGPRGISPHIGENGNWWLDDVDTGVAAAGRNFTYEDFTPEQLEALRGPKGADGTMIFSDLTEEQKASLKGEPGKTPVKGQDYFTTDDVQEIAERAAELLDVPEFTPSEIGALGWVRTLTSADNLDDIVNPGIYAYAGTNYPTGAPYASNSIVEVIVANIASTPRLVQRVTRYGVTGHCSFRVLSGDGWTGWSAFYTTANKPSLSDIGALGFVRSVAEDEDLNDIVVPGIYSCPASTTLANAPFDKLFVLEVIRVGDSAGRLLQRATRYGTEGQVKTRGYYSGNGKWAEWSAFYTEGNKPTAADVGAIPASSYIVNVKRDGTSEAGYYAANDNRKVGLGVLSSAAGIYDSTGNKWALKYDWANGALSSSVNTPAATNGFRQSKLVSTETNPTINGQICWQYK